MTVMSHIITQRMLGQLGQWTEQLGMIHLVLEQCRLPLTPVACSINTRKYPNATEVVKGPFTITSSTSKVSTRAKGRQMSMKIQSTGTLDDWSLGTFRVNAREDGLR